MANPPIKPPNSKNEALISMIGHFVLVWSHFETLIGAAIMKRLKITPKQAAIVMSGLGFERKISILRALMSLHRRDNKKPFAIMDKILSLAKRNVLLHAAISFTADDEYIEFIKMDTDRTIKARSVKHSVQTFATAMLEVSETTNELRVYLGITWAEMETISKIGESLAAGRQYPPLHRESNPRYLRAKLSRPRELAPLTHHFIPACRSLL